MAIRPLGPGQAASAARELGLLTYEIRLYRELETTWVTAAVLPVRTEQNCIDAVVQAGARPPFYHDVRKGMRGRSYEMACPTDRAIGERIDLVCPDASAYHYPGFAA